jgi:hypothetical protein
MSLADVRIRTAKAKSKPYKLFDGGGLFIVINPTGSKLWRLKYRFFNKERLYSIGAYPDTGAAEARQIRDNVKKLISQGIDPVQNRKITRYQKMEAGQNTLEVIARRWFEIRKGDDEHRERSLRRLELYAFPKLGLPIGHSLLAGGT